MSDYMTDISSYLLGTSSLTSSGSGAKVNTSQDNSSLDMTDFLTLMVAQFQNQSIDNTADTSDMLNQLVQMSTVQAITNITDATVMMYAGSLVGKEVTIGQYNSEGTLEELVGTVTGTGVSGGQQVIFVNGQSYYLSQIMAVGRLPDVEQSATGGTQTSTGDTTVNTTPSVTQPDSTEDTTSTSEPNLDFDAPGVVG
ncbi:MAG: flagellar hook capping FlgD N-terminal domain-containing protein [Acutalibacter sp.]|jgi:flagellar basal-body rod modification protein FlgD